MNFPQTFAEWVTFLNFACLTGALLCAITLTVKGPDLPTRVIALSLNAIVMAGLAISYAIITGLQAYIDIAVAICLIEFLSTLAFARYIQHKKEKKKTEKEQYV